MTIFRVSAAGFIALGILFFSQIRSAIAQEAVPSSAGSISSETSTATQPSTTTTQAAPPQPSAPPPPQTPTSTDTTPSSAPPINASEASGLGVFGKLPFQLEAAVHAGYDDNPNTTNGTTNGSAFSNASLKASYKIGDPRTQLTFAAHTGLSYYFDRVGSRDYDYNADVDLDLLHKVTPRLTFGVKVYATYQAEPNFQFDVGSTHRNGDYFFTHDRIGVIYEWLPRFGTITSYSLDAVKYSNSNIGNLLDRFDNTFANQFRFLLAPTTALVAEYRYEIVTYRSSVRDSMTQYLLGGVDHRFNPRLDVSLRGGVEFRNYAHFNDRTDPYAESSLNYAVGRRTSVSWLTRYSTEEADISTAPSRETFRTGLQVKQNLTPRISGSLDFYYEHDANEALTTGAAPTSSFTEQSYNVDLALRYAVNGYWGIDGSYTHSQFISGTAGRPYSRNLFFGGLYVKF